MTIIKLDNICKSYQMGKVAVPALKNITLEINAGEYIAILGPSGSGKSTLMNILGCLDTPSNGHYYLDNKDVSHLSRNELANIRNHKIGFIFQSFNLLDYGSTLDNVALPLVYRGMRQSKREKIAADVLSKVGLKDRLTHKPNELSGGQRQRVAIARALATDPQILLADEPTGNLDTQSGNEVIKLFEGLAHEGKTVIIVTHDQKIAERTNRIIKIKDGEIESDTRC